MKNENGFVDRIGIINKISVQYQYSVLIFYIIFVVSIGGWVGYCYNIFESKVTTATKKLLADSKMEPDHASYNELFEKVHEKLTELNANNKLNYGIKKGWGVLEPGSISKIANRRQIFKRNQPRELKPTVEELITLGLED